MCNVLGGPTYIQAVGTRLHIMAPPVALTLALVLPYHDAAPRPWAHTACTGPLVNVSIDVIYYPSSAAAKPVEPDDLGPCISSVYLESANIEEAQNIYTPDDTTMPEWNLGPNIQFYTAIQRFSRLNRSAFATRREPVKSCFGCNADSYDLMYYMEPDTVPLKPNWLGLLMADVERHAPFSVLGSKRFESSEPSDSGSITAQRHLNGNAVYNLTSPILHRAADAFMADRATWHDVKRPSYDVELSQLHGAHIDSYQTSDIMANFATTVYTDEDVSGRTVLLHGGLKVTLQPMQLEIIGAAAELDGSGSGADDDTWHETPFDAMCKSSAAKESGSFVGVVDTLVAQQSSGILDALADGDTPRLMVPADADGKFVVYYVGYDSVYCGHACRNKIVKARRFASSYDRHVFNYPAPIKVSMLSGFCNKARKINAYDLTVDDFFAYSMGESRQPECGHVSEQCAAAARSGACKDSKSVGQLARSMCHEACECGFGLPDYSRLDATYNMQYRARLNAPYAVEQPPPANWCDAHVCECAFPFVYNDSVYTERCVDNVWCPTSLTAAREMLPGSSEWMYCGAAANVRVEMAVAHSKPVGNSTGKHTHKDDDEETVVWVVIIAVSVLLVLGILFAACANCSEGPQPKHQRLHNRRSDRY